MNKERQLAILELKIAKKYVQTLISFTGKFPKLEEKARADLAEKNYTACFKTLQTISKMLMKIHADDLALHYLGEADELKNAEHKKIESFVTDFFARISILSIEIQIAAFASQKYDTQSDKDTYEPVDLNSILAVDDVAFFLNNLKSLLKNTRYKLTCVNSGEAALRYLRDHRPALFLLDIDMPKMDGFELARKIREIGQKSPIIYLTGNSLRADIEKAIKAGAVDFIVKPINQEQVINKIKKHIKP